jgi:hypothetical protein
MKDINAMEKFQSKSKVFRHSSDIGTDVPQGGTNANRRASILPLTLTFPDSK